MRYLLSLCLLLLAGPALAAPIPAGYTLYKNVPLTRAVNGIDGKLELLQDARITPDLRKQLWDKGDVAFVLGGTTDGKMLIDTPLAPAILRLVNAKGNALRSLKLEMPLAELDTAKLYGTAFPTFLVEQDYSVGNGSSGPAATLYEVKAGKLAAIKLDGYLGKTLHLDWKIVDGKGKSKEIQTVYSHAIDAQGNFVTDFSSYRFDGKKWVKHMRREDQYWESGGWPPRAKFP